MMTRLGLAARLIAVCVSLVSGSLSPRISFANSDQFVSGYTVLGQTGAVTVNSTNVLSPWQSRLGISTLLASGSGGNRFDLLLTDPASQNQVFDLRGGLALGLPGRLEAAVTIPYLKVDSDQASTAGLGNLTVSAKWNVRDQADWVPGIALSASWIDATSHELGTSSVTTNGYLASVATQLALVSGDWAWTMMAEVGGFWRDPGRPESSSSLEYGVAGIVPLSRTGFTEETGEIQLIAEINGTFARRDVTGRPDDATSFAPGLRYVTRAWGATATGTVTTYEQGAKDSSAGALVEFHVVF